MIMRWGQISLLALVSVVMLFVVGDTRDAASQEDGVSDADGAEAEDFVQAIGRVEAGRSLDLVCEVPGGGAILEIVEDGALVNAGDLLVRLDDSSLKDELVRQEVAVAQARADLEQVQAQFEVQNVAAVANRQSAELRFEIAELELNAFREGSLPLEIQRSEARIEIAEKQSVLWSERVERLEAHVERSLGSVEDLEAARIEMLEARANLDLAQLALSVLVEYEGPLRTKTLELGVAEARTALEQADQGGDALRVQSEAGGAAAMLGLQIAERQLDVLKNKVENCTILAPREGVVAYPVARSRRGSSSSIEVGSSVREGQTVLEMPDLSNLRVLLSINEERVVPVRVGQPVRLIVGESEEQVSGTVAVVGDVREASGIAFGPRPRTVVVEFDEQPAGLRIGARVRVAIDVSGVDEGGD